MIPGGWEWIIILVVVLLIFGGRKLPELARSVGRSIVEFKVGMKDKDQLDEGSGDKSDEKSDKKTE